VRFVIFCHSLLSDWNHGNAHFLRGIATELASRGHSVDLLEPHDAWSLQNLLEEHGTAPLVRFRQAYPLLDPRRYDASLRLETVLEDADVVMVHEWNHPALVAALGAARARGGRFTLLFHDTHHRAATAPGEMERFDLHHYDGVLAFGETVRQLYLERGWADRAWTWHEAADTRVFRPLPEPPEGPDGDLVWIGNWGDEERSAELAEFLVEPVRRLGLRGVVHGVRYPAAAQALLHDAGIEYRGWLPNFEAPRVFARFRATVHVPRQPYVRALPGIPTIRPFEAMACGIPLVSAPWEDSEGLFTAGADYLVATDGAAMEAHLRALLHDPAMAAEMASHGLRTILARHTCAHRADELLEILAAIGSGGDAPVNRSLDAVP
jgi:spore maturation protein CgeB